MYENYDRVRLVNLTGHDIEIVQWNNRRVTLKSQGQLRVQSSMQAIGRVKVNGIEVPLLQISEVSVDDVPEIDGVLYVVSGVVAAKAKRKDFVVPSRVVRDSAGRTRACRAFARVQSND